jgi:hypothetical protein
MRHHRFFAVGALLSLCACEAVTVPNFNAPGIEPLTTAPDAASANAAAVGLLQLLRGATNEYALRLGILGREVVQLTSNETRNVTEMLEEPLSPNRIFIDFGWSSSYRRLLAGTILLGFLDRVPDYTPQQREAVRGFAKTLMAMALIDQLRVRDTFGIVLDVDPTGQSLGEFVSREEGYDRARTLLDEGKTHLAAAGGAFPFSLHTGFTGFNTPQTFLLFNRAIVARMEVYRGNWQSALDALNESFLSTAATTRTALDAGVYNFFAAGEALNGLFDGVPAAIVAVPTFLADAERRADGSADLRASSKAQATDVTLSLRGISSNLKVTRYANNTAPVPVIRNEELILLRAEAYLGLGDRAAAIQDLNFVRVNSGGLEPLPDYTGDLVTQILYNRAYSLFYEYGHRWFDARRYGRLASLPKVLSTHRLFPLVPVPSAECNARGQQPRGCIQVDGI